MIIYKGSYHLFILDAFRAGVIKKNKSSKCVEFIHLSKCRACQTRANYKRQH